MGLKWVIFTDLDGTLQDHASYQWAAARDALGALRERRVPLVVVTSKTRAEVLAVLRKLGRREPFVVENGGAIYFPAAYFPFPVRAAEPVGRGWQRVVLGASRSQLVKALARAARRARVAVRSFAEMSAREVAARTGLGLAQARRALRREYDEPFVILDSHIRAWPRLRREIHRQGLRATRGSRFFHILGATDKGAAVRRLMAWFRRAGGPGTKAAGLGDSPNDVSLLHGVDVPIVVARPGNRYDRETLAAVSRAQRAGGVGPAGWNRAVLALLRGRLP